jgi:Zn-dependent metalloprotease
VKADTVILRGQIDFPGTTMPDLASRIVSTAQTIYGSATAAQVRAAFAARGIL